MAEQNHKPRKDTEKMQSPEKNNYEFHEDAGHGWLRVPFVELIELGVQPTEFSYTDGEYAYLEEDEDTGRFIRALDPEWCNGPKDITIWEKWHIGTINDGNQSFIRSLDHIGKITPKKPTTDKPKAKGHTLFPEIFDKWGIETESAEERKSKDSLNERHAKAVRVIKKLKGWRSDLWYLMPVIWLEAKAAELCEKADAERAERAERERQMAEQQQDIGKSFAFKKLRSRKYVYPRTDVDICFAKEVAA